MKSNTVSRLKSIFNTMKTFKSLAIAVSSLCVLPAVAHGKTVPSGDVGMAMMRLNASPLSDNVQYGQNKTNNKQKTYGGSVWNTLRNDFRMAEVNSGLVRSHEYKFATNSAYFNRTLNRSKPYMYHIVQEVKKRGMPAEIALLPFIESAYVTKASSHVGASGLWQFMPATGRHYGLEQTPLYDGRHDVYAATNAALNYLQYLHGLFGDWSLALAAYNWGEGNVTRAVRRAQAAGLAPTYENLKMPNETRNYVPKLLAVRNLVSNPQAFGLNLPDIQNAPYFQAVTVNNPLDIMAAAHLANISESEFLALNPAFKTPVFIPKGGRKMLLPVAAAKTFETNYKNTDAKALLSWDVFTPNYNMTLAEISAQTGTDVSELRRLNGLNGGSVSAGRSVLVAKNGKATTNLARNFLTVDTDNRPDTFVEQQPVLSNFVAQNNTPIAPVKVTNQVANIQKREFTDFVAQGKPNTSNAKLGADIQVAKASVDKTWNSDNLPKVDFTEAAIPTVEVAQAKVAPADDPLLALANERARALQQARENVAKVNREEEIRAAKEAKEALAREKARQQEMARAKAAAERAARLAEAKEAKRKEQERQRAERLEQAQQLAAMRQARENGQSIAVAIKEQQKAATATTHRVREGDTLFNIAQRYNLNVADLVNVNNLRGNHIRIGQVLKVSNGNKAPATSARNTLTKVSRSGESNLDNAVRKPEDIRNTRSDAKSANDKRVNTQGRKVGATSKLLSS